MKPLWRLVPTLVTLHCLAGAKATAQLPPPCYEGALYQSRRQRPTPALERVVLSVAEPAGRALRDSVIEKFSRPPESRAQHPPASEVWQVIEHLNQVDSVRTRWGLAWLLAMGDLAFRPFGSTPEVIPRAYFRLYSDAEPVLTLLTFGIVGGEPVEALSALHRPLTAQQDSVILSLACEAAWILVHSREDAAYDKAVPNDDPLRARLLLQHAFRLLPNEHRAALLESVPAMNRDSTKGSEWLTVYADRDNGGWW